MTATETPRVSSAELAGMLEGDDPSIVLDVRTRSQYEKDEHQGSQVEDRRVAEEASSARAARRLIKIGFRAAVHLGGYDAWKAEYQVEPSPASVGGPVETGE